MQCPIPARRENRQRAREHRVERKKRTPNPRPGVAMFALGRRKFAAFNQTRELMQRRSLARAQAHRENPEQQHVGAHRQEFEHSFVARKKTQRQYREHAQRQRSRGKSELLLGVTPAQQHHQREGDETHDRGATRAAPFQRRPQHEWIDARECADEDTLERQALHSARTRSRVASRPKRCAARLASFA